MKNDRSNASGPVVTKASLDSMTASGTNNFIQTYGLTLAKAVSAPLHVWTLSTDIVRNTTSLGYYHII